MTGPRPSTATRTAVRPSRNLAMTGSQITGRMLAPLALALVLSLPGCSGGGWGCLIDCKVPQLEISIDVAVADLNGDGRADVIQPISTGVNNPGSIATFLQSNGGFGPRNNFTSGPSPDRVVAADLNGDALADVIVSAGAAGAVVVMLNDPADPGSLVLSQTLSVNAPARVAIADLDGDGLPDLVIPADDVYVALQSGGTPGHFGEPASLVSQPAGAAVMAVATGDVDGDGVPDIAEADQDGVRVLFLSRGAQGVTVARTLPVYTSSKGFGVVALAVADVDGDGRNDLVIVDQGAGEVVVLLQDPAVPGTFLPSHSYPMPGNSLRSQVLVTDLNADAHPDLVVDGTDNMLVLLQDASHPGTFAPAQAYDAPIGADGLGVGDMNGDGLPDIVTSGGSSSVTVGQVLTAPPGAYFQDAGHPGHFLPVQNLE